jgi:uncharacterized membrane protein YciS (DUF1049 family)
MKKIKSGNYQNPQYQQFNQPQPQQFNHPYQNPQPQQFNNPYQNPQPQQFNHPYQNPQPQQFNYNDYIQPAYDTTANIGIFYNIFGVIMSIIIGSIFISIGIMILKINKNLKGRTSGSVIEADCDKSSKSCLSTISYNVNEVNYKNKKNTNIVNKGQTLEILYDTTNPNNFEINYSISKYIGWGFIIFSIFIIILSIGWLIFSLLFKPIAAATGVGAVADVLIPNY